MDSVDLMDLAKLLQALVTVEAMRGANEARAAQEAVWNPAAFDHVRIETERVMEHMDWYHNRD